MKKHYFIIFSGIALLLMAGCSIGGQKIGQQKADNNQQNQGQNVEQNQQQNAGGMARVRWNENFSTSTVSDIEIGGQVLVMGAENSDGSVAASQIIIDPEEVNFSEMGGAMRPEVAGSDNDDQFSRPSSDFNGQRSDFAQFQNMSEEERVKFREEMMAKGEAGGAARIRNGSQNALRLNGEIIDKDDASITLKLESGGSRLVFISNSTVILQNKK